MIVRRRGGGIAAVAGTGAQVVLFQVASIRRRLVLFFLPSHQLPVFHPQQTDDGAEDDEHQCGDEDRGDGDDGGKAR